MRNSILDKILTFRNGSSVSKKDFEELQEICMKSEISVGSYLSDILIHCSKSERQRVKWARLLLSSTTADLFRHFFPNDDGKMQLADLIDAVSDG